MAAERLVPAYLVGETSRVVVFACDDPRRGDDSVATLACTSLPAPTRALADIKLIGPMEAEYIRDIPPGVRAVIVDAVIGSPPGEIVEVDLFEMSGRPEAIVAVSTHKSPLDQVVAIGQLLRDEPVIGRFVGIAIEAVETTAPSSGSVDDAVRVLRAAVARAVAELAQA